jgi:proteasome lid subunit RPN8/RPN11
MPVENRAEGEFITWTAAGCPFTIAYAARMLDDIRAGIVEAFYAVPRGGVEIGGVLLGKYEGTRLSISGYAPVECEHLFGPSFTLSQNDQKNLEELLLKPPGDGEGLEPVGWYHSHTRSEIFLSEADLDIYRRYFPKPWQVALVLRPSMLYPTRAGFFFREADGAVHSAASRQEFVLDPTEHAPSLPHLPESLEGAHPPSPPSADLAPSRLPASAHRSMAEPAPKSVSTVVGEPSLETTTSIAASVQEVHTPAGPAELVSKPPSREILDSASVSAPDASMVAADAEAPASHPVVFPKPEPTEPLRAVASASQSVPLELSSPSFQTVQSQRSWRWLVSIAALSAGIGIGIIAVKMAPVWLPPLANLFEQPATASVPGPAPLPAFELNTADSNGQLQVRWDSNSRAVREAREAMLTISDGGSSASIPLDPQHLASGSFAYLRQGERVDVKLSLQQADGKRIEEATGFLGKLPERRSGPENPQLGKEQDEVARQAARLQVDRPAVARPKKADQNSDLPAEHLEKKGAGRPSFDPLGP